MDNIFNFRKKIQNGKQIVEIGVDEVSLSATPTKR